MDSLVVCACEHTIGSHEYGRCSVGGCDCARSSADVLNAAIDRTKIERQQALVRRNARQAASR